MNRVGNKGFLLAEALIVSTFVLTVLIYLFVQFKNIMIDYKKNYSYNTVEDIYNLGSLSKYIDHNNLSFNSGKIYESGNFSDDMFSQMASEMNIDYILYTDSDIEKIKSNISQYDQDVIDFISKVKFKKIENKGRLVAKFKNGNFASIVIEKLE